MTAVPKPLKFLRPHWEALFELFGKMPACANKPTLADMLSVMAMTMAEEDSRNSLKLKLVGSGEAVGEWGHEYISNLAGEIGVEFAARVTDSSPTDDLMALVDEIVPFHMKHNAEPEACDLLMEVERLSSVLQYVDEQNFSRVGLYLTSCAAYLPEPDDSDVLKVACKLYRQEKQFADAMRVAQRLNEAELIAEVYHECDEPLAKKQLALLLGRQHMVLEEEDEELQELMFNAKLSEQFLGLAEDLEVMEPKTPEEIYKTHLQEGRCASIDSARGNLASTFVNAFVNAGFGRDKLMLDEDAEDEKKWLYKNKEHGMMSAAASVGALLLWDVDGGITQLDKYLYSNEDFIQAGALLGVGIVHSGVRNDCDPALALLSEYIMDKPKDVRLGAIAGLGFAYAGTAREEIPEFLEPVLSDTNASMDVVSIAALSLGLVFAGSCNEEVSATLLTALSSRTEKDFEAPLSRFLFLAIGMVYLSKGDAADDAAETVSKLPIKMAKYGALTIETCAYAGTGDVLKVQKFLGMCGEKAPEQDLDPEEEVKKDDKTKAGEKEAFEKEKEEKMAFQFVSVLGIALAAMSENIGCEMALRMFDHVLQYGELSTRRAVPLALGMLSISNPQMQVTDTLGKLSHDPDPEVAQGAMLGLGLVSAGTNNSRVASMLRALASYWAKEPHHLFVLRIAQGLLHMGKGLLGLSPYHADRSLMSPVAVAGLLVVMHAFADAKTLIHGKYHWLLYYVIHAMFPRMLVTVDENMDSISVPVRVGAAVDIVGQAGKPKTITGFQTHTTPVLLGHGERAELATEEYIPVDSVLEGVVILKLNPDFTGKKDGDGD